MKQEQQTQQTESVVERYIQNGGKSYPIIQAEIVSESPKMYPRRESRLKKWVVSMIQEIVILPIMKMIRVALQVLLFVGNIVKRCLQIATAGGVCYGLFWLLGLFMPDMKKGVEGFVKPWISPFFVEGNLNKKLDAFAHVHGGGGVLLLLGVVGFTLFSIIGSYFTKKANEKARLQAYIQTQQYNADVAAEQRFIASLSMSERLSYFQYQEMRRQTELQAQAIQNYGAIMRQVRIGNFIKIFK